MGNARAKEIWEANVPPDARRPSPDDSQSVVKQWITAKYEYGEYKATPEQMRAIKKRWSQQQLLSFSSEGEQQQQPKSSPPPQQQPQQQQQQQQPLSMGTPTSNSNSNSSSTNNGNDDPFASLWNKLS